MLLTAIGTSRWSVLHVSGIRVAVGVHVLNHVLMRPLRNAGKSEHTFYR